MPVKGDATFMTRWKVASAWPAPLPAAIKEGQFVVGGKAESLTKDLLSLEEPWQGRFLDLVANLATSYVWDKRRPTREEVTTWLGADVWLYQKIKQLLNAWRRPGRRPTQVSFMEQRR